VPDGSGLFRAGEMKTMTRLLQFLRPFSGMVVLSILTGTATVVCAIGLLGTSAYLLSMAALQPSIAILQVAIVGVRFFGLSRGIFRYLERITSHTVNLQILGDMRVWFYQAIEPLAPARLMEFRSGDILSRAVGDIDTLENLYVRVFAPVVTALLITVGMGLFVGTYDPALGWILIIGLLTSGLIIPAGYRFLAQSAGKKLVEKRGILSAQTVEFTQGLSDLLLFDQGQKKITEIIKSGEEMGIAQNRLAKLGGFVNGLLILVNGMIIWMMLRIAIPLVNEGVLDGVGLSVLILSTMASFEVTTPLVNAAGSMEASLTAARRLFDLVDAGPEVQEPKKPLEFRAVTFGYNRQEEQVLTDFSLELKPGQRIAIVGESGAGKSTVINLLMRFWQKDSGQIFIGGIEIERLGSFDVRSKFSQIPANGWLFRGTLLSNLRIAKNQTSEGDCLNALSQAGLAEWVRRLPDGIQTTIGERGITLSGGERQRIMIARAILQDAPIMLLDEPTNGLDALTEQAILKTLFEVTENRSSLWIMHRLIGLEKMDEILVLEQGRIVERGNYDELIARRGKFWQMIELQRELLIEQ
jgi:ATP-binding cassette subfamily C protein CydC